VLHTEYLLVSAYAKLPIEANPFLAHWVTIIRTSKADGTTKSNGKQKRNDKLWQGIWKLRLRFVQDILAGTNVSLFLRYQSTFVRESAQD
jgi:hypothetical protein